jgi:hypothetical protein
MKFGTNNQGWYRLIWYDANEREIPEGIKDELSKPRRIMADLILKLYPELWSIESSQSLCRVLHRYIHGELSTYITGRIIYGDRNFIITEAVNNCYEILNNRLGRRHKDIRYRVKDLLEREE